MAFERAKSISTRDEVLLLMLFKKQEIFRCVLFLWIVIRKTLWEGTPVNFMTAIEKYELK